MSDAGKLRVTLRAAGALGAVLLVGVGLVWGSDIVAALQTSWPTAPAEATAAAKPNGARAATGVRPQTVSEAQAAPGTTVESGGIAALADADWVRRAAQATGIPERALTAYAGAAITLATEQPTCGIGWNTLAGVGEVESHHGTFGGGSVRPNGDTLPHIIGVALDGNGVAAIPDTDGGRLDGDTQWDRALGPMQFIPSTWSLWGADGTGDGKKDPHQIDDAALAAGRYLCSMGGGSLTNQVNWERAIAGYNDSHDYAVRVSTATQQYALATR